MFVAARTLAGGRAEGLGCTFGTGLGGLVHVAAGAAGVSALVLASAEAFTLLELAGALCLVRIGIRTWREAGTVVPMPQDGLTPCPRSGFRDGIVVEALNPKTAAVFLAFIPQFVDPAGAVAAQFVLLGTISVVLNTAVDAVVVLWADPRPPSERPGSLPGSRSRGTVADSRGVPIVGAWTRTEHRCCPRRSRPGSPRAAGGCTRISARCWPRRARVALPC